jgi:acyl-coenzyme A synthetase/AMP-(fatty) acid ligase
MKSGRQLLGEAELLAHTFGIGATARVLSSVPAHHIYGLLFGVLVPLLGGGAFFRDAPAFGKSLGAAIKQGKANVLCSVPPHLHGMQTLDRAEVASLERVFCSGARLPSEDAAVLRSELGLEVTEVLGSTETGGIAWRLACEAPAWTPLPGVHVAADEQGALLIDSPFLDASAPRPQRANDRIRMLDSTRFEHVARTDSIVKVGGERVSLTEVEQHLRRIPGVRDAAVLAVDDPGPRQNQIWAVVAGAELVPQQVRRDLADRLEALAVPRRIACVDVMPREATGKLQRDVLLTLFAEDNNEGEGKVEGAGV